MRPFEGPSMEPEVLPGAPESPSTLEDLKKKIQGALKEQAPDVVSTFE